MSETARLERLILESRERLRRSGALKPGEPDALDGLVADNAAVDIFAALARELDRRDGAIEELSRERSRLETAQQSADLANAAKSKFVANMSHELRTPLNAIIGYGEILIEGLQEAGMAGEVKDSERIVSAGRHLLKLVDRVLAFSEIDGGETEINPSRISVRVLLGEIVEANRLAAKRNGDALLFEVAAGAEHCFTDERILRTCLQSVIENAIKFTKGGEIRIECERDQSRGADALRFSVLDTGIGMSSGQQEALFEPFASADDEVTTQYGGVGLGLAIARRCARLLGGDIEISSVRTKGSVFTVSIAQTFGVSENVALDPALVSAVCADYILLVDDDESAEKTRQLLASELGAVVVLAKRAGDALALARLERPALVLLDVRLGGAHGWGLLEAFASDPDFGRPAVVVTTADEDRARSLRLGAALHLTKPLDRGALIAGSQRLRAAR